jgi:hydroxyquinol 1,2-dioxygenase
MEIWQADEEGLYDVQYDDLGAPRGRGHLFTGQDGRFWFWSVKPEAYPIPADGPVGDLLAATGRSPMRPAHIHFLVQAPGFARLVTHVFAAGDPYLTDDAVFGVKDSLVAEFVEHEGGVAPDGSHRDGRWTEVSFDLVLAREDEQ